MSLEPTKLANSGLLQNIIWVWGQRIAVYRATFIGKERACFKLHEIVMRYRYVITWWCCYELNLSSVKEWEKCKICTIANFTAWDRTALLTCKVSVLCHPLQIPEAIDERIYYLCSQWQGRKRHDLCTHPDFSLPSFPTVYQQISWSKQYEAGSLLQRHLSMAIAKSAELPRAWYKHTSSSRIAISVAKIITVRIYLIQFHRGDRFRCLQFYCRLSHFP